MHKCQSNFVKISFNKDSVFTNNTAKIKTSAGNHGQDLLGKGDDDTARQSEETIGTLGRIVGLQGQTHLHDTPAQ